MLWSCIRLQSQISKVASKRFEISCSGLFSFTFGVTHNFLLSLKPDKILPVVWGLFRVGELLFCCIEVSEEACIESSIEQLADYILSGLLVF